MSTATDMLAKYLAAEQAILSGKEHRWGDRALTMEDLAEIRKGRQEWETRVSNEQAGRARVPSVGGLRISHSRLS